MELSSTQEDYLETIYRLEMENRVARPRDIGDRLDVAGSSVTAALQNLSEKGLVNYEPYGLVTLTETGLLEARKVLTRHRILQDFLANVLGLDEDRAEVNACEMEHAVDPVALERLVCFLAYFRKHSDEGPENLGDFRSFMESCDQEVCRECVQEYLKLQAPKWE